MNNYEAEALPIAKADEHQQRPIIALVEKILAAKRDDPEADIMKWEEKIDTLVYKHYGVTEEEKKLLKPQLIKQCLHHHLLFAVLWTRLERSKGAQKRQRDLFSGSQIIFNF